jgi:hypothetical protein
LASWIAPEGIEVYGVLLGALVYRERELIVGIRLVYNIWQRNNSNNPADDSFTPAVYKVAEIANNFTSRDLTCSVLDELPRRVIPGILYYWQGLRITNATESRRCGLSL